MSILGQSVNLNSATDFESPNDKLTNSISPGILGIIIFIIVIYYYLFYSLGIQTGEIKATKASFATMALEIVLWGLLILLVSINVIQYYYDINITAEIKNFFSPQPKIEVTVKQPVEEPDIVEEIKIQPQVFHLKENKYTYENAKAVCNAYGARLANYDDMQKTLKEGGEWCSYGWSENQAALFPTQKATWEKLQKISGHENDCGRPGINGGYIANPNVKFGVNCFGYKPQMNKESRYLMDTKEVYPKSQKEIDFENRVKKWRGEIKNLVVAPFNKERWSVI